MTAARESKRAKTVKDTLVWWTLFLVATYAMSLFIRTFKAFTMTPDASTSVSFLGAVVLLAVSVMCLMYDAYVREKEKNNVHNTFFLFEWIYGLKKSELKKLNDGGADA